MTPPMTPLERVESLYRELIGHYREGEDAELRAAAKLLLVAIAGMRLHGGPNWQRLVDEYVQIAGQDPERFERLLHSNRARPASPGGEDELIC